MLYVYCQRASEGRRLLVQKLREMGIRSRALRSARELTNGDMIVSWGEAYPYNTTAEVLNGCTISNKYEELAALSAKGIPTPAFSLMKPDGEGWLGRKFHHKEGRDLLTPPPVPDFYVKRLLIHREFRVHVFNGRSIRAGIKTPRAGYANPHEWVRSWNAGWYLDYGEPCQLQMEQRFRDVAKAAIEALDYDFGAVDIGIGDYGNVVVFEVNRAPGLEGVTVERYAEKLREYYQGHGYV